MKLIDKVCPLLLRRRRGKLQILAFRHPRAGRQIVKGTLEEGEEPAAAVLRELTEESGIDDAVVVASVGLFLDPECSQRWHIFLCRVAHALPDEWSFYTSDGGGHTFAFFWHNLDETPGEEWYPLFQRALAWIGAQLGSIDGNGAAD